MPQLVNIFPAHMFLLHAFFFHAQVQRVLQEHTRQGEVVLLVYRGGKLTINVIILLPLLHFFAAMFKSD